MAERIVSRWDRVWVALAVGVCLVAKVWVIRRVLGGDVDVLDLAIPPLLLTAYELVWQMAARGKLNGRVNWASVWLWVGVVVVATALSLVGYG